VKPLLTEGELAAAFRPRRRTSPRRGFLKLLLISFRMDFASGSAAATTTTGIEEGQSEITSFLIHRNGRVGHRRFADFVVRQ
jgi:hypothetical protein